MRCEGRGPFSTKYFFIAAPSLPDYFMHLFIPAGVCSCVATPTIMWLPSHALYGFLRSLRSILNLKTFHLCPHCPWYIIMIACSPCFVMYLSPFCWLSSKTILFILISRNQYSNYFWLSIKELSVTKMILEATQKISLSGSSFSFKFVALKIVVNLPNAMKEANYGFYVVVVHCSSHAHYKNVSGMVRILMSH